MFLVIADTHLGATDEVRLTQLTELLSKCEVPVIWLGDAFDTLRHEYAYEQHGHLVKPKDLWIAGNHDYAQSQLRTLTVGKVFLTHGDMIDFGLLFARLQVIRENKEQYAKASVAERILSKTRAWVLDDVFNLYQTLYHLSDADIAAFSTENFKFKPSTILAYIRVLIKLLCTPTGIPTVMDDVPTPAGNKMSGYVTHDPLQLLKLTLFFYPEAKLADTIIVGHTHHPIDEVLTVDGKTYRFITLGAWVGNVPATYAKIKEDNTIEVIHV